MTGHTKIALIGMAGLALLFLALQTASWRGPWTVVQGGGKVLSFELDVNRLGVSPVLYWLAAPERLVAAGPPEQREPGRPRLVLAVDPRARRSAWLEADGVDLRSAVSVAWSTDRPVARHSDAPRGVTRLVGPAGESGPVAERSFTGFGLPRPVYDLNLPAFGEPGWRIRRAWFGRARLTVHGPVSGPGTEKVEVEMLQTLVNDPLLPDLPDLATWLPGGRFLLLDGRRWGDHRVFVLGPFEKS